MRPMDFNKRRKNVFDRLLAKKPELDRPSSHFFEHSAKTQESMEIARSAASRRKAK
jgi:hypothetical protein